MTQVGGFWGHPQALARHSRRQARRGWSGTPSVLTTSGSLLPPQRGLEGHPLRRLFWSRRSHMLYQCQPRDAPHHSHTIVLPPSMNKWCGRQSGRFFPPPPKPPFKPNFLLRMSFQPSLEASEFSLAPCLGDMWVDFLF